ncbi:YjcQ family protein [Solibacillus sp. FSL W8-0474]|uniref:YjcQ family protein n=1 Tax=Solibacillus sp. FSL W8-0474 TaxID=2975336 RepID=UPI0030F7F568
MDKNELIKKILISLNENIEPNFNDLGVDKDTFGDTVEIMQNEDLITGANVQRGGQGNKVVLVYLKNAKIQLKGLDYLENN